MKNYPIYILLILLVLALIGSLIYFSRQTQVSEPIPTPTPVATDAIKKPVIPPGKREPGTFCIQVITPAKNPATGECREFPTPCDVPDGWEQVSGC